MVVHRHPRDRLLAAAIEHLAGHGLYELRLRDLAVAIGTSHRMLIYHFGSKEGLLRAIVEAVEAQQREVLARFLADPSLPLLQAARTFWQGLADPTLANQARLFFAVYAQALQGQPGTEGFVERVVDDWVDLVAAHAINRGVPADVARADARLGVAVTRGLLLDLVGRGDWAAVDQAHARYLELYAADPDLAALRLSMAEHATRQPRRPQTGRRARSGPSPR